jgi:hypothetical protein
LKLKEDAFLKKEMSLALWSESNTNTLVRFFMSRLASFRGPSTPSSSPAKFKPPKSPASPSRQTESTFHRKTRTLLQELRSITETWDGLVLVDGLKAARELVDARTDLECAISPPAIDYHPNSRSNALKTIPEVQPKTRLVGPKLATMDKCITMLDVVLNKLVGRVFSFFPFWALTKYTQRKQFQKMNNTIENMEQVLYEAHKVKGWTWVHEHPLWVTWSLEMFGMLRLEYEGHH